MDSTCRFSFGFCLLHSTRAFLTLFSLIAATNIRVPVTGRFQACWTTLRKSSSRAQKLKNLKGDFPRISVLGSLQRIAWWSERPGGGTRACNRNPETCSRSLYFQESCLVCKSFCASQNWNCSRSRIWALLWVQLEFTVSFSTCCFLVHHTRDSQTMSDRIWIEWVPALAVLGSGSSIGLWSETRLGMTAI